MYANEIIREAQIAVLRFLRVAQSLELSLDVLNTRQWTPPF